jgi:uncharacterized repeat protein (TIGR01451 family)
MKSIITLCFSLLFMVSIQAQGWDFTYQDSLRINHVSATQDGGCVIFGNNRLGNRPTVLKVDGKGKQEWVKYFPNLKGNESPITLGQIRIFQDGDGNYWFSLPNQTINGLNALTVIVKLDRTGNQLFQKNIDITNGQIGVLNNNVIVLGIKNNLNTNVPFAAFLSLKSNGDTLSYKAFPNISLGASPFFQTGQNSKYFVVTSRTDTASSLKFIKFDVNGNIINNTNFPAQPILFAPSTHIFATSDGGFIVPSSTSPFPDSLNISRVDSTGRFIWQKSTTTFVNSNNSPFGTLLIASTPKNGGFIAVKNDKIKKDLSVRQFSLNGNIVKNSNYIYGTAYDFTNVIPLSNGGYIVAGNIANGTKLRLIKLDENGYVYPYFIRGNIASDRDENCKISGNDIPISRVLIQAKNQTNQDFYALSDSVGNYDLNVDLGTYNVSVVPPSRYMTACTPSVSKTISLTNTSDTANFPLKSSFFCGLMQVDVTTPRLRRCFNNNYTVTYCNKGTDEAKAAYVNITLDSLLEFVSADKTVASKTGRVYRFNLGNLPINDCGSFDIVARVRCGDSTRLNQTLCVEAKAFPDTLCNVNDQTLWSGASLRVNGTCKGDSVVFQVQNIGKATSASLRSVTLENDNTVQQNNVQLAANGIFTKSYPANGNTWRMTVNQELNHPRSTQPTAFVEGCRKNANTPFVTGFAANYANDDANISLDVDCQPIIGAYDPNDKTGYPLGFGAAKGVPQNQDIEYMIRFQNTGTDTAFTVVIRDTIESNLDIKSIEWGASSHKYRPDIYGQNIVKFTFDNINLVDSFTNEPASNGYVRFRIKQKKDVAFGTKIQNSAGIYFDFNEPVITNKTLHTVSKNVINAVVDINPNATSNVKVYPNPFSDFTVFELQEGSLPMLSGQVSILSNFNVFELYDMTGRRIQAFKFEGNTFKFEKKDLETGVYLFKIVGDNSVIGVGKVSVF